MNSKLIGLLILLLIIIGLAVSAGIFLPEYIFGSNAPIYQLLLTFFLIIVIFYLTFNYLNRKFAYFSYTIDKINTHTTNTFKLQKYKNRKCLFNYIEYFSKNLNSILDNYDNLILRQNSLLKNYTALNKQLKKGNLIKDVMLQLSHSILKVDDKDGLFDLILKRAIEVIDGAEKGSLIILNKNNLLEYRATIGYDMDKLKKIPLRLDETFLWKKTKGSIKKPCIIRNVREFDNYNLSKESFNALDSVGALNIGATLSTPILIDGKVYGMINIDSYSNDSFSQEDIFIMEYFSNQVSVAITNHQLFEKTLYLSRYDSLTDTYNRSYFDELLRNSYKRAQRYGESFCLVVLDLDNLKQINDTHGHLIGDKLISKFAAVIKNNIRETDLFSRYGGDEFVIVFLNSDSRLIKNKISNIMNEFKQNPLRVNDIEIDIPFSYGISNFPNDSKDLDTLFKMADMRMYENKYQQKKENANIC